jgi:hypothetical protein
MGHRSRERFRPPSPAYCSEALTCTRTSRENNPPYTATSCINGNRRLNAL